MRPSISPLRLLRQNSSAALPLISSPFLTTLTSQLPPSSQRYRNCPRRSFLSSSTTPQTLTATRTLPYPAAPLYALIADITAYPSFVPYCTAGNIVAVSAPDPLLGELWPRIADLSVGWGPYDERFRSRVYCLPNTVIESVAGEARCSIPPKELPHYYNEDEIESGVAAREKANSYEGRDDEVLARSTADGINTSIFTSLLSRWTLREFPFKPPPPDGSPPHEGFASEPSEPQTEVSLVIEVQFANPAFAALSQAAMPKVAGIVVEAFEKRAKEVLG
ncbi:hypothetical protein MMC07_006808 [Pseudocyphellaria aurata]|nr:hypothetical protein [Pseudocyphellaria aurata]